jgi:hypothetical protein
MRRQRRPWKVFADYGQGLRGGAVRARTYASQVAAMRGAKRMAEDYRLRMVVWQAFAGTWKVQPDGTVHQESRGLPHA